MRDITTGNIMANWKPEYTSGFGKVPLKMQHNLHKSSLFSDEALASLLEQVERTQYHVNTRSSGSDGVRKRREGEFGDLSGSEILKAVETGDIWINLRAPQKVDSAYGDLLEDIYREFEMRVPGLKTFRHLTTILISSPNVYVPYHADVPGQMLWQIRGTKKVWVYPNEERFLPQPALEKLILGEFHETDMPYSDELDAGATTYDLEPGWMLHWPLNCPHRVVNHDCLNISLTTEHYTGPIRTSYAVNYANGLLRKKGMKNLSRSISGPGAAAKTGLAAAVKLSGIRRKAKKPYRIDFKVDPDANGCVRDIEPYEMRI